MSDFYCVCGKYRHCQSSGGPDNCANRTPTSVAEPVVKGAIEFWEKHAIGQMSAPSCFGCGQIGERATQHLELANVYLCARCASLLAPSASVEPVAKGLVWSDFDDTAAGVGCAYRIQRGRHENGWEARVRHDNEPLSDSLGEVATMDEAKARCEQHHQRTVRSLLATPASVPDPFTMPDGRLYDLREEYEVVGASYGGADGVIRSISVRNRETNESYYLRVTDPNAASVEPVVTEAVHEAARQAYSNNAVRTDDGDLMNHVECLRAAIIVGFRAALAAAKGGDSNG